MTRTQGVKGPTVEQALERFDACGCADGRACCLVTLAIEREPRNPALFEEAALLYEQVGDAIEAERARMMGQVFGGQSDDSE